MIGWLDGLVGYLSRYVEVHIGGYTVGMMSNM